MSPPAMSPPRLETPAYPPLATGYTRWAARVFSQLAPWKLAAALALLLYVPWLGERSLWYPDEPDVAEPAITMLRTGDWIVPRHNDDPWLDYPPLTYWLGAASSRLAGSWSPFALRLPVALLAALLVAITAWATQRLAGRRAALWAGLSLATAPHFAYQAVNYHPDMAFALLITAGIIAYAWGAINRDARWSLLSRIAGFAGFGGAILAKGPLGLLLPGLILVLWHASARQWRALFSLAPLSLAALAVAMPWYLQLVRSLGWEEVWRELYLQNFARFGAANRGHDQPWWYYLSRIGFDWAPWSLVLPASVAAARRRWREPAVRLALIWLFASLIFFSCAATKREVYLLPAFPAIAFLLGRYLADALEAQTMDARARPQLRWFLHAVGGVCVAAAAATVGIAITSVVFGTPTVSPPLRLLGELAIPLGVVCAALSVGGVALLLLARRGVSTLSLALVVSGLWLVYAVALGSILPSLDERKSYRDAAESLRTAAGSAPIGFYPHGIETKRAGFRVEDPAYLPLRLLAKPGEVAAHLSQASGVVILHPERAHEIARSVPDWEHLSQREVQLGSRRFLMLETAREGSLR
ncbi:MAG: glycosyltransferase family 39 protein [Acidobacteriota bacterium]